MKDVSLKTNGDSKEIQVMSEEYTVKLFKVVKNTGMKLLVVLLFDSLVRRSVLLGAQWRDMNLDTGQLTVRHTYAGL